MKRYPSIFLFSTLFGLATAEANAQWRTVGGFHELPITVGLKSYAVDRPDVGVRVLFEMDTYLLLPLPLPPFGIEFDVPVGWNGGLAPAQVRVRIRPPCEPWISWAWRNFTAHSLCDRDFTPKLGGAWDGRCNISGRTGVSEFVLTVVQPVPQDARARTGTLGSGCAGAGRRPTLTSDAPRISPTAVGNIVGVGAASNLPGVVLLSRLPRTSVNLGSGCTLRLEPASVWILAAMATNASGTWSAVQPGIPAGLEGSMLSLQAVILPTNGPLGLDLTAPLFWYVGH